MKALEPHGLPRNPVSNDLAQMQLVSNPKANLERKSLVTPSPLRRTPKSDEEPTEQLSKLGRFK